MSRRKQPQRLPPPITQGEEAIESVVILDEFPGELAALLWKSVRAVQVWTAVGESERARSFEEGAYSSRLALLRRTRVPEEIAEAIEKTASVLQPRARSAVVAKACEEIAEWASDAGKIGTSIEFMQAAALAAPADAELALQVGGLARAAGQYHRAETWYRQAISRARRSRAWSDFARSYIGLGIVFTLRGNYPQAYRSLLRGLRAARRFSIRHLVAAAAHELVVVGIRTDRAADVSRFGRIAVSAYGAHHPRLPALSHDLGIYLLNAGYFEAAYRIIQATPPEYGSPADQLVRWSSLARVAAALGLTEVYAEAAARAEALVEVPAARPVATEARLALAVAADLMGREEGAIRQASMVRELAGQRGEAQLGFAAESLIESIRNGAVARRNIARAPLEDRTPRPLDSLVADLESALGTIQWQSNEAGSAA